MRPSYGSVLRQMGGCAQSQVVSHVTAHPSGSRCVLWDRVYSVEHTDVIHTECMFTIHIVYFKIIQGRNGVYV